MKQTTQHIQLIIESSLGRKSYKKYKINHMTYV